MCKTTPQRVTRRRAPLLAAVLAAGLLALATDQPAQAYIEVPYSLPRLISESTHIQVLQVDKVDKQRNSIVYRKVSELKGKQAGDLVNHNIGQAGFNPREWQTIMAWAEPGKTAVVFHNGSASETCIDGYWYQCYAGGAWWNMSHGEPYLLRGFAGKPEKLAAAVTSLLAGQEVVVPAMVDGNKEQLQQRTARIQRLRVSMKNLDYSQQRDFVGWGDDDLRRLLGMPGFSHQAALGQMGQGVGPVAVADFGGDGKTGFALAAENKFQVMQLSGTAVNTLSLPVAGTGARALAWGDYNGDGRPDLLLAAPLGPRLLTNQGQGQFRDDTAALPRTGYHSLTAAAFLDYDADGKPDLLLADSFRGLRLLRNQTPAAAAIPAGKPAAPVLGPWHYIGPFDNPGQRGFDTEYPPEKEIDLRKEYPGKGGAKARWREGSFTDGQIANLALFDAPGNENATIYLYRAVDCAQAVELPVSLGSDDTLTVWCNGEKVHAENVYRGAAPDQAQVTLKLKASRNHLLLKVCQGGGGWSFYFQARTALPAASTAAFEDVSDPAELGVNGIAARHRGAHLLTADFNGDGRSDILYGAGQGVVVLNTAAGLVEVRNSGLRYAPEGVMPALGDFDGDGRVDLFVPQADQSRLYRNLGDGRFAEVTARSGALAAGVGHAACAAWVNLFGAGKPDLVVGCTRGPNRVFRNNGNGSFVEVTELLGFHSRSFNTRGIAAADVNGDGAPDLILNNQGQDSVLLIGDPTRKK